MTPRRLTSGTRIVHESGSGGYSSQKLFNKRLRWSQEQDLALLQVVSKYERTQHTQFNWKLISNKLTDEYPTIFGGMLIKPAHQCRARYRTLKRFAVNGGIIRETDNLSEVVIKYYWDNKEFVSL